MKKSILAILILLPFLVNSQITLIPDTVFEQYLIDTNIDSDKTINGQILTSDVVNVKKIDVIHGYLINNFTGLESFISLEELHIPYQPVTNLDLSKNVNLKVLNCIQNNLTNLDLSQNINLEELYCSNTVIDAVPQNKLSIINLEKNKKVHKVEAINILTLHLGGIYLANGNNTNVNNMEIDIRRQMNGVEPPICIVVDDKNTAINGNTPYNSWIVKGVYNFNCILKNETFLLDSFKIYPNPTTNYLFVNMDKSILIKNIQILNINGKLLKSIDNNFQNINISDLASGSYLLVINTNVGTKVEKVIKK
ncbi:T9SS type A sorting domain-containing protein [Flavobacterium sp. xlx-214]|nr:T9SS type A sorting domain-containing protein [Flavobacterium sp. xlx-214]QMI83894.1 T9SS type A sorting domain-containing protein [Flavobacterium sp. xlx-214]